MKHKFLLLLVLVCLMSVPTVLVTKASSFIYDQDFTVTYDSSVYNSQNNIYNGSNSDQDIYFNLSIKRNTGLVMICPYSNNVALNYARGSTFTNIQTIDLSNKFSVSVLKSNNGVFQYSVARNPYIEITQTYNITDSSSNGTRLNLQSYSYKVYHTPTIGGSRVDITSSHLIKSNGTETLNNTFVSSISLKLFPDDYFSSNTNLSYFYFYRPYYFQLNYNNPLNQLYYLRSTSATVFLEQPFYSSSDYNLSGRYYNYYTRMYQSYYSKDTGTSVVVNTLNGDSFKKDITSSLTQYSFIYDNNVTYNDYYSYNFSYLIGSDYINKSSTNTDYIDSLNYYNIYIPTNPLLGLYSNNNYTSGLISLKENYYVTPTSDFDFLAHLYNFIVYIIFDMPLVSDIIQFFGYIVDFIIEIFSLLTSFGGIPLISIILGLFFLIFFLRFLL